MARAPDGPVPVVVMGLGFIGQEIARAALSSPEVELMGAVDSQPSLVGRPLGDVLGQAGPRFKVSDSLEKAVGRRKGVVVLHATSSRLSQVMDQLLDALKLGLPVASTCEELAFPHLKYPELADKLERAAQKAGVAIVGTGVNPGFVLDRLVATAGQVCGPVRKVTASRVVDARTRREALQRKVGAGLTEEEFFDLVDREELGHVGLVESAAMAAVGLGLDCDDFEEEVAPVFAEEDITGGAFVVKKGRVAGMFQSVVGLEEGQERVRLELTIAVGADNPRDRIEIDADPKLVLEIPGGVAGDRATANALVNAAPRLTAAEAGLLTVLELPSGR
ncbi:MULTISPECIES: NAD(P)H-dependent amine dehydrogenase family protein [unclassified Corallococcus]|uniref:NAD(P)H-dependent amine dehydrogenase family protein n=1 Tax=unclassified Corallococcus TaxID=2685029 RepID=UPI001A8C1C45|nr:MULTISPECIES: dihydrodipicolinate reductase [unclassified Corallococcus]MBN9684479.1 dihydrodipicolinate reductase [Corallococcus sp. NCSPR001]WAS84044.1 dihydrodipicolinate reductase [Corallococcus sp. NCRR]